MLVKEAIEHQLNHLKTSQNELARRIGVSPATIIACKTSDWGKISEEMLNKFKTFFKISDWPLRETDNMIAITEVCLDAQQRSRFLAIAGFTGAGKTEGLGHYTKSNSNAFSVMCYFFMSQKGFLAKLQQAMGISQGGSIEKQVFSVAEKLNSLNNPLLIIDDAGKLSDSNLMIVMALYDLTEGRCGIVIGGTEYLKERIDKSASDNRKGFRELQRRIAYWQPLHRPSVDIVSRICQDNGINSKHAIKYIAKNATNYGLLKNMVQNANDAAQQSGTEVTVDLLAGLSLGDAQYREVSL